MALTSLGFGKDSGSQSSGPANMPFLQQMWQSVLNMQQQLGGYNQTGGWGSGPVNSQIPPRPVPTAGHSARRAMADWDRQYGQAYAAEQAQRATGGQGMNGQGGTNPTPLPFQVANNLYGGGLQNLQTASTAMQPYSQSGYAGQQIRGLQDLLQQNLGQSFGQIRDASQMAGGYGGSGMGIQQNQAIQDANRTLFQGAGDIMQQDLMRQQQAAAQGGALNLGAQGQLGGQYNLGINAPLQSMFQPLTLQGNLNQGYNSSQGQNSGWRGSIGFGGG